MSSENLLEKLNERVTSLQERSRYKQLSPLAILTKVNHFALKYMIKRARAKYLKDDCLNVIFCLEGGIGDFCIQFQWVKAFLDQHLADQSDKHWGVILVVNNVNFISQMIGDYPFIDKICTYKEYISHYKCHLYFEFTNVADFIIQDHKAIRQYEPQLYEQLMQGIQEESSYTVMIHNLSMFESEDVRVRMQQGTLQVWQGDGKGAVVKGKLAKWKACVAEVEPRSWFASLFS